MFRSAPAQSLHRTFLCLLEHVYEAAQIEPWIQDAQQASTGEQRLVTNPAAAGKWKLKISHPELSA
eukprot:6208924-Pleurochrysis_carterae.AAC.2